MFVWILAVGNPADGFDFVGPFDDANDANEYGDRHHDRDEYWCVKVRSPIQGPAYPTQGAALAQRLTEVVE